MEQEQFQRVIHFHGVVHGPGIGIGNLGNFIQDECGGSRGSLNLRQSCVENLAHADQGDFLGQGIVIRNAFYYD